MPNGTITFLFTDIEGSTRAWLRNRDLIGAALARHDALIENLVAANSGQVVRPRGEGDSRFAVFARASDAVLAACAIQLALLQERWALDEPIRVRMAIHTGEAELRVGDYYGPAVNHCARLRAVAHGGQVLVSTVTAELMRDSVASGNSLHDLGVYRLPDLEQPERIWQVAHAHLPAEFPPLRTQVPPRHNLPNQLSGFVGRQRERSDLERLLDQSRLVTLTGSGGIGKTRLAVEVAHGVIERYRDGVWFVELASVTDPALVATTVAQRLRVHERPASSLLASIADALADRVMLLVLDNCEHMLDACAELAVHILAASQSVHILATSREPLGVSGEIVRRLQPLHIPRATMNGVDRLLAIESVQLFVERVSAVGAQFELTNRGAPVVAELCRRLDGLPLAIELVAARTRFLSADQILDQLNTSLLLLGGHLRSFQTRHQTLQAALDWSYNLLSAEEQRLFARLGVFAGGWTLEAAEAVGVSEGTPSEYLVDALGSLVDKSLVVTQQESDAPARFRLLEPVSQYSRKMLEAAGDAERVRLRHAAYFQALAEQAEPHLRGGADFRTWIRRLAPEQDNLRTALRWCVDRHEIERGLKLGGAVWRWWFERGTLEDCRQWLDLLTQLLADETCNSYAARALNGAGVLALSCSDYQRADRMLLAARSMWTELGELLQAGACLHNLASVAKERGDFTQARSLFEQALTIASEHGDKPRQALIMSNLGSLLVEQSDLGEARNVSADAIQIYRELHDDLNGIWPTMNLAWSRVLGGDALGAQELFAENLAILLRDPDMGPDPEVSGDAFAESLDGLALVASCAGDPERAVVLASAAENVRTAWSRNWEQSYSAWKKSWLEPIQSSIEPRRASAAWARGVSMSLVAAVSYALQDHHGPAVEPQRHTDSQ